MMHTGLGRTRPLHIEYIHIGAALAVIQDILSEAILSHPRLHIARKIAIVKALGKVIWIQNDLFTKWYVNDGEEFTEGVDYAPLLEKEGYLHGKKVLTPEDEAMAEGGLEGEKGDAAAAGGCPATGNGQKVAGVCPFTGMVAGVEGLKLGGDREEKEDMPKAVEVVVNGQ
jgi:hypothetical protein